jgi:hypothetical protein
MPGERHSHGVPQSIFDDGTAEADFQVNAPRLSDRVEVIAGLVQGIPGLAGGP